MNNPIIKIKNLTYNYDSEPSPALSDLSLEIAEGSFVAVLGSNGSGKSTLAKLLNAILLPAEGSVFVCGFDTRDESARIKIRQSVGLVFQNPDNQIVANVVEDDVAFAPENLGVPPDEIRRRVDEALSDVGMSDYRLHAPHLLSGGQKQRVAIAGALAMHPQILVLDEPTAMLDPVGRREVLETLGRLRGGGMTIIFITHHMDECIAADRVLALSNGKLFLDGAPEEVFCQVELLRSEGLDVPDTTALLWEMNRRGFHFPLDALTVEACARVIAI